MEVNFNYEIDFRLSEEKEYSDWIARIASSERRSVSEVNYIFCDDNYLLRLNEAYLNHDTLTDIITFDYCDGHTISGDIFISYQRVTENADVYNVEVVEELRRVMAHGLLHLMGYKDKSVEERQLMRLKENEKMDLFHVEH